MTWAIGSTKSMDVLPMEVPDLSWMVLLEDVPGQQKGCTGGL